eukprot:2231553-Amphidinium_carterae.1
MEKLEKDEEEGIEPQKKLLPSTSSKPVKESQVSASHKLQAKPKHESNVCVMKIHPKLSFSSTQFDQFPFNI